MTSGCSQILIKHSSKCKFYFTLPVLLSYILTKFKPFFIHWMFFLEVYDTAIFGELSRPLRVTAIPLEIWDRTWINPSSKFILNVRSSLEDCTGKVLYILYNFVLDIWPFIIMKSFCKLSCTLLLLCGCLFMLVDSHRKNKGQYINKGMKSITSQFIKA